jgi:phosphatidylinositol alpha-1,6-mannosyltransferase
MAQARVPRVLFGTDSLRAGSGGIGRVARLIGRALDELQHDGRLRAKAVAFSDREPPADLDLPVKLVRRSQARFALSMLRQSLRCTHVVYDAASMGQVHRLPWLRRRPALMYVHGIEVWENAQPGHVAATRRMTTLLVNSAFTRQKAERLHGGFLRAKVCWLATESDDPAKLGLPWEERPPEVLVVGRLHADRPKGHREMIACWPEVVAAVPGATLSIVGTGPDTEALKALAAASPAAGQIVFHGFVTEEQLEAHYGRARVYCMPSRGEGFGLVYIEAMRHGLPVIGSVHDAAPEIVADGRTGCIVDPDRPGELAASLIRLLREPGLARELGEAGRRRWAEHFRYGAFRDRFVPLLEEFLTLSHP